MNFLAPYITDWQVNNMCSIFKYGSCVGRNFDYDISYKEELRVIEANEHGNEYKVMGMCTGMVKDYPLFYDGINSEGVVCGALAFENNAVYLDEDESKVCIPAYDFVFHILSDFASVKEIVDFLDANDVIITNTQYSEEFPNSALHWFAADVDDSIVIEQTSQGLKYYHGSVMTNNPPYDLQLKASDELTGEIGDTGTLKWNYPTRGLNTWNLNGDYTSMGRFSRLTYLKERLEESDSSFDKRIQSFHLLSSVEQIYGATPVGDGFEYTIYSVVYDMRDKMALLKFYDDAEIRQEGLNSDLGSGEDF